MLSELSYKHAQGTQQQGTTVDSPPAFDVDCKLLLLPVRRYYVVAVHAAGRRAGRGLLRRIFPFQPPDGQLPAGNSI